MCAKACYKGQTNIHTSDARHWPRNETAPSQMRTITTILTIIIIIIIIITITVIMMFLVIIMVSLFN